MGHHYNPQKYLEGFCEPDHPGFLWQYDKKTGKFSRAAVKRVAQERAFYSPDVEIKLNTLIECPANPVLGKLREKKAISEADRVHLAMYIATMMTRVPRHRQQALRNAPQLLTETVRELKEEITKVAHENKVDPVEVTKQLAELDETGDRFRKELPPQIIEQIRTPFVTQQMVELIFGMKWLFVSTEGPSYFLTCDNPVFFFQDRGLGRPESELTFPLSSNLCLWGGWQDVKDGQFIGVNQKAVKEFNRRIASLATRFLFYQEKRAWIADVGNNDKPYLSRIRW